jgi:F-type H+-transporting ATPase subunit epsilon
MQTNFVVKLLSPAREHYIGKAKKLYLPGSSGYLDIGASHAPMVAELACGSLCITTSEGKRIYFFISGGLLKIHEQVVVLGDIIEKNTDIDKKRAQSSFQRAKERLEAKDPSFDVIRALRAQRRAEGRLLSLVSNK